MSSIRMTTDWVMLFAVTAVWFMFGAVIGLMPILGPIFVGRAFIEAHMDHRVPIIAMLVMVLGVTFGQLASTYLIVGEVYAFGQIFLFALSCIVVWCRNCYVAWKSRPSQ